MSIRTFAGSRGTFTIDPSSAPCPRGPQARLQQAAVEAWPRAMVLRAEALDQTATDPILLVCCVDSAIGKAIVDKKTGSDAAARAACGPFVFAVSLAEMAALFGRKVELIDAEIEALKAKPGEPIFAMAVNGGAIDWRRVYDTPAPACMTPAEEPPA